MIVTTGEEINVDTREITNIDMAILNDCESEIIIEITGYASDPVTFDITPYYIDETNTTISIPECTLPDNA